MKPGFLEKLGSRGVPNTLDMELQVASGFCTRAFSLNEEDNC